MQKIYPSFFPAFQCKADGCRHTCCQKWEINIDEETLQSYKKAQGPLGRELSEWIGTDEEGNPCFRLNEKGYCHFLNEKGLCRLILEIGPNALCQICRDHPRFYKFAYDSEQNEEIRLAGTGLACEKTAEQLLALHRPLSFIKEGSPAPLDFKDLLSLLHLSLPEKRQFFAPTFSQSSIEELIERLKETNPIDEEWTSMLSSMESRLPSLMTKVKGLLPSLDGSFLTNLYRYIFYRQLDECEAYDPISVSRYAEESVTFILLEYADTGDLIRSVTHWSEQIEYDTENVYILLDALDRAD